MWTIKGLTKFFGPIRALEDVTFSIEEGKIYGLLGGNGAGKSTFVKLVTGVLKPDRGKILKDEKELLIKSPKDARNYGIVATYQEFSLIPDLMVINNILFNIEPLKFGFIDIEKMIERVSKILEKLHTNIPLFKEVRELSPNEKQVCEIVKALILNPQMLLLDEPTNYLYEDQKRELFAILKDLRNSAKTTIVFISHRIEEVFELCDKAIVLRDGKFIGMYDLKEMSVDEIIKAMAGESSRHYYPVEISKISKETTEKPMLTIEHLNVKDKIRDVTIHIRKGEIVGLAGLMGQGQSELLRALYGLLPYNGKILIEGKEAKILSPRDALKHGIVYISGNSLEGVFLSRSVKENISITVSLMHGLYNLINNEAEEKYATDMIKRLNITCRNLNEPVQYLSGGNRQKVYLARGLTVNPRILLLDDPLKGVDIMTKKEITRIMKDVSREKVLLFFSSDLEEILPIADRVLVFFDGKITHEFFGQHIRRDLILEASLKGKVD